MIIILISILSTKVKDAVFNVSGLKNDFSSYQQQYLKIKMHIYKPFLEVL